MLVGVDEDRVAKVGGKAAILEEILRRWPQANIPTFEVFEQTDPIRYERNRGKVILRASSELDVFGGFGLHDSYSGISSLTSAWRSFGKIKEPDALDAQRISLYAKSVGRESSSIAAIQQSQGKPLYWALVMEHPNNPDFYLIAYSTLQSIETKTDGLLQHLRGRNPDFFSRAQFHAIWNEKLGVQGELDDIVGQDAVNMAVKNHRALQGLKIIHPDYVSISEIGIYKDRVETYQFTPVRKRFGTKSDVAPDKLILGGLETTELPVVMIPYFDSVEGYIQLGKGLELYPNFKDFIQPSLDEHGRSILEFGYTPVLFWRYMSEVEEKYPHGYLVMTEQDLMEQFDITMRNAKAVLLKTYKAPTLALNHNTSRLAYKTPVLVVGLIRDNLEDGQVVKFSSDGSSYSIKK